MNNRNLLLLFSVGAIVVVLAVLVPVLQQKQVLRQQAQGLSQPLPTQAYRNPFFPPTNPAETTNGNVTVTLPPEGKAYQAPNDTIPPTVTFTSPQNGSQVQVNTSVTLSATATDNIGVSKVEFLVNGNVLCVTKSSPYTCVWQVPFQANATYVIIARAYDLTGNLTSQSIIVHSQ